MDHLLSKEKDVHKDVEVMEFLFSFERSQISQE